MKNQEFFLREMDQLGRIVIPRVIRETLGIETGMTLKIVLEKETVMIKKQDHSEWN